MPTTAEIREMLHLPRNTKTRQVLNRALREWIPDGAKLLDTLEKMDYLRIQDPTNPHYAAELGKLLAERDRLIDAIRAGQIGPRGKS